MDRWQEDNHSLEEVLAHGGELVEVLRRESRSPEELRARAGHWLLKSRSLPTRDPRNRNFELRRALQEGIALVYFFQHKGRLPRELDVRIDRWLTEATIGHTTA